MKQRSWLERADRVAVCLIVIGGIMLAVLLLAQFALQFAVIREWVTGVDRIEGLPFSFVA